MSSRITNTGNTGRTSGISGKKSTSKLQKSEGPSFVEELAGARERADRKEFEEMIADVDREASKLTEKPSYENMESYRAAVRKILQQAINGSYRIKQQKGSPQGSSQKVFTVIELVDKKLEELAKLVAELDSTGLLAKLDEIRGILVDAYL